jgi:hypothetical protein
VLQKADVAKINQLEPETARRARWLLEELVKQGTPGAIGEAYRSQARQDQLWAMGRSGVNAKLPQVTWTQLSAHTSRRAFDLLGRRSGGSQLFYPPTRWYELVHQIAARVGFKAMLQRDPGHFELPAFKGQTIVYQYTQLPQDADAVAHDYRPYGASLNLSAGIRPTEPWLGMIR